VNAIRHTPPDGTVHIEASDVSVPADAEGLPDEPHVRISVTDACGGIPEADLTRVFDVAWRGTQSRTPQAAGSDGITGAGAGLGLAIVRGIAEAHSGDVTVVNVAGGCRFQMWLPVPVG
jgi:signal transduction histidine kinase